MAKWGEGDPRWIVEERPDGTNVNNWHWTEKNATPWSKARLKELLEGLSVSSGSGDSLLNARITKLTKMDGEATASNRKSKLIFLFEWELKAEWEGTDGDAVDVKGELDIPNLSDENEASEVDVTVTTKEGPTDAAYKLKQLMHKQGAEEIRRRLATYIRELKEEFSQGLVLPTAKSDGVNTTVPKVDAKAAAKAKQAVVSGVGMGKLDVSGGCKIATTKLSMKEEFKCPAGDLYAVFTRPEMLSAFSHSAATADAVRGGRFGLYGGMVEGSFEALEPPKALTLSWRLKSYPPGHHAQITLTLTEEADCTKLALTASGVPESEAEKTEDGWRRHYFENIKRTFGYGAALF